MKIDFTGRGFEVTDELRTFTVDKMNHLGRIQEGITHVQVVMSVEKYRHRTEINLSAQKHTFHATEETGDMRQSVDKAIDKLEAQIRKAKSKQSARKRNTGESIRTSELEEPPVAVPLNGSSTLQVIPSEKPVRHMSVEEAAEELQKFNQEFLAFRNADNASVNVVYRRKDGHIGLINP